MTRTISLITATVGAALLFAVPAYADNWGADQRQRAGPVSPDLEDRGSRRSRTGSRRCSMRASSLSGRVPATAR